MTSNQPNDVLADVEPFVISREFDAPRNLMWKLWTDCEHMKVWNGPKGFTSTHCEMDLRPGGSCHYNMVGPDGSESWGIAHYREIVEPEKLVWVTSFSDAERNIIRHPMAPDWPLELLTTVKFSESAGKTTVHLEWIPINASEAEIAMFEQGRDGMKGGWTGTFEELEKYIAQL